MAKIIYCTGHPYAHTHGTLVLPDNVSVKEAEKYLKEHRSEITWDEPELDYAGTDIDIDEIEDNPVEEADDPEKVIIYEDGEISARNLMNLLAAEYEGKDISLGKAFSLIDYVLQYASFDFEEAESLEELARVIGFEIKDGLYLTDNEPLVGEEEVNKLRELLYQKVAETEPEHIFAMADYISDFEELIESSLIAGGENLTESFRKALTTIREFYISSGAPQVNIDRMAEQEKWYTDHFKIKQLVVVHDIMKDYMFHLSEQFGKQSNTSSTIGSCLTQAEVKEVGYDYAYIAHINRAMTGGFLNASDIMILYKLDDTMLAKVELKLFQKVVYQNSICDGEIIADISEFEADLTEPAKAQKKLIEELNDAISKVKSFLEVHPEADGLYDLGTPLTHYEHL